MFWFLLWPPAAAGWAVMAEKFFEITVKSENLEQTFHFKSWLIILLKSYLILIVSNWSLPNKSGMDGVSHYVTVRRDLFTGLVASPATTLPVATLAITETNPVVSWEFYTINFIEDFYLDIWRYINPISELQISIYDDSLPLYVAEVVLYMSRHI